MSGTAHRRTGAGATCADARIAVVLPVFKNRPHLPELYSRLTRVLEGLGADYVLRFVDDAGGDGSLAWLRQAAERDDRVRVIAMEQNVGQHAAVVAGLRGSDADIDIVMDADLQDPPEYIPRLLEELRLSGATVMARRTDSYQTAGRHLTGRVFKALLRRIAGGIPAGTGMYLAMPAAARQRVLESDVPRPYLPLLLAATGIPIHTVNVPKSRRSDDSSAYTPTRRLRMGVRALGQALRWRLRRKRLRRDSGGRRTAEPGSTLAEDRDQPRPGSPEPSAASRERAPTDTADSPSRVSSHPPTAADGT